MKYRKKPVEVEAMQWKGNQGSHFSAWTGQQWKWHLDGTMEIPTLEGTMTANPSDFIVRGLQGEFYPCKLDIFEATYEAIT